LLLLGIHLAGEKATQHNAYELLQLINDYALCIQQKALLEEDLLDQRQEITELEKRIKKCNKIYWQNYHNLMFKPASVA
jgi:hypothetical protein